MNELSSLASLYPKMPITQSEEAEYEKLNTPDSQIAFIQRKIFRLQGLTTADRRIWAKKLHEIAEMHTELGEWKSAFATYNTAITFLLKSPKEEFDKTDEANILCSFELALKVREKRVFDSNIVAFIKEHWNPCEACSYPAIEKFINTSSGSSSHNSLSSPAGSPGSIPKGPSVENDLLERLAMLQRSKDTASGKELVDIAEQMADTYFDLGEITGDSSKKLEFFTRARKFYVLVKHYHSSYRVEIDISILHVLEKEYQLSHDITLLQKMESLLSPLKAEDHGDIPYFQRFIGK